MAPKVTIEEQLRRAQIEAARVREQIRKSTAGARRKAEGSSPRASQALTELLTRGGFLESILAVFCG
jgi:hypothetical protein